MTKKNNNNLKIIALLLLAALLLVTVFLFLLSGLSKPEEAGAIIAEAQPEERREGNLPVARYRPEGAAENEEQVKEEREVISSLSGKVISLADGHPITGAKLLFSQESGRLLNTTSKSDGSFYFLIYEEGIYELKSVTAPGFMPLKGKGASGERFNATTGLDVGDVIITLQPQDEVTGQVIDENRQGVEGAEVWYMPYKNPQSAFSVKTISDGYFTISVPDHSVLEAHYKGYKPGRSFYRREMQQGELLIIMLGANLNGEDVESIGGRVLLPDGEPAGGAMVMAYLNKARDDSAKAPARSLPDTVYSDDDGYFEIPNLLAGNYYLSARLDGYQPARLPQVESGTGDAVLNLTSGLTIRGQVLDQATGAPVQSYTVILTNLGGSKYAPSRSEPVFSADGRYEIKGLSKHSFTIAIAAAGYAASDTRTIVPFGEEPMEENFELVGGGRVFGKVTDEESGSPIGGAVLRSEGLRMSSNSAGSYHGQTLSDNNGNFEFYGLPIGTRSLAVSAPGYNPRLISGLEISPGGSIGPLDVTLTPIGEGEQASLDITGIGAVLGRARGGGIAVVRIVPGGGAAEVGLKKGDRILAVNGLSVEGRNFNDVVEEVRGPEGSVVTLLVQKGGAAEDSDPVTLVVPRRRVKA